MNEYDRTPQLSTMSAYAGSAKREVQTTGTWLRKSLAPVTSWRFAAGKSLKQMQVVRYPVQEVFIFSVLRLQ